MSLGAAMLMIGKITHPLTRPRFDPRPGRVVEGHGILQPRVTPSLPIEEFPSRRDVATSRQQRAAGSFSPFSRSVI